MQLQTTKAQKEKERVAPANTVSTSSACAKKQYWQSIAQGVGVAGGSGPRSLSVWHKRAIPARAQNRAAGPGLLTVIDEELQLTRHSSCSQDCSVRWHALETLSQSSLVDQAKSYKFSGQVHS